MLADSDIVGLFEKREVSEGELVGRDLGTSVGGLVASSEIVGRRDMESEAGGRVGENVGGCDEKEVGERVESLNVVGLRVLIVGKTVGAEDKIVGT